MGSKRAVGAMPESKRPRLAQSSHPHPHESSTYGKPMPFKNLQCKVFLSHSGVDKDFVRHLYKALCSSYHGFKLVAFFDEDTIPKAEAVSMENILMEVRTSKLGVLVLTDDFFTSTRNPMLELEAFVGAEVKLLPLFLTMSVDQFKEKERRDGWMKKWREWSAADDKLVNLESWRDALSFVSKYSGLECCKMATNHSDFIDKVVKHVTRIIGPAIPLSNPGVIHGKDRLCQIVDDMYKEAASKPSLSVDNASNTQAASTSASNFGQEEYSPYITSALVGIHGFPGLGKTTLCKWLCNFYHRELSGRVCYIDVGSSPASPERDSASFKGRLQHVLSTLNPRNNPNDSHHFQSLSIDQLQYLLRNEFSSMEDPVFLAIDNILPEMVESQEEADYYLGCEYPEGSRIFITSRSESVLTDLSDQHEYSFSVVTAYMPCLAFEEARDIFVQEFPGPRKLGLTKQQEDDVNECVELCTIGWEQYNPLMLKSLAAFIRWTRRMPNVDWKGRMAKVRSKGIDDDKSAVWSKVFSVFNLGYELLNAEERKVFLDLALICNLPSFTRYNKQKYKWISMLHSDLGQEKLERIIWQLQDTCFIEKERSETIKVPNLMVECGKHKAKDEGGAGKHYPKINGRMMDCPEVVGTYVVVDDSSRWPDHDHLPSSARHISISRIHCKASVTQVDLRDVKGVEVLHLVDNAGLQDVLLSPTTCAHLGSLILIVPKGTALRCILDEDGPSSSPLRRGGLFLKWMQLQGNVCFQRTGSSQLLERGLLAGYSDTNFHSLTKLETLSQAADPVSILVWPRNLEALELGELPNVQTIDLTTCCQSQECHIEIHAEPEAHPWF